jgi:hypothetical protein
MMRSLLAVALVLIGCGKSGTGDADGGAPSTPAAGGTALAVLEAYRSAAKCTDRLALIVNPTGNAPLLAEKYKGKASCVFKHSATDVAACEGLALGGLCRASVHESDTPFCLTNTTAGFKVDWRCTNTYNPTSIAAFKSLRATTPTTFRVGVKLSDYYNFEFARAKESHLSVRVRDSNNDDLPGYIERTTGDGQKLFELTKDGREHRAMVELAFPEKTRSPSSDGVRIVRLVSTDWAEQPGEK